jgi:hypothetical protein
MNRLAWIKLSLPVVATLLAPIVLDAGTADAKPVVSGSVRDRRTEVDQPPPPPSGPTTHRRYRRRPGPRLMMPIKLDIGATGASTTAGFRPGIEMRLGIHWASLSPRPTNTDVGLGVFGAVLPGKADDTMPGVDDDVLYGGAYLEVGQTLTRTDHTRTWLSGRGEYLGSSTFGDTQAGFGVAGRLSAELYASGAGIEPRGLFLGTYAIGVYAEAAARGLGDDVSPVQVSAGLTFRTPLVYGR